MLHLFYFNKIAAKMYRTMHLLVKSGENLFHLAVRQEQVTR